MKYLILGTASKRFEALRKRFNRRRKQFSEASRSGSGTADVAESSQNLKEYAFLAWLQPYIKPRNTKTNLRGDADSAGNDEWDTESNLLENEDDIDSVFDDDNESDYNPRSPPVVNQVQNTGKREAAKQTEARTRPAKKLKQTEMQKSESEMVKTMTKVMQRKLEKPRISSAENSLSTDDLFGKLVASEIKQFPTNLKILAKHEINNVIHKFQMQACNQTFQQGFSSPPSSSSSFSASPTGTQFQM